jgi:drug/metabolite transporter (DMT)-like permease
MLDVYMKLWQNSKKGAFCALLAAVLFGSSVPFLKPIVGQVPSIFLAGLLYLGAGAGLWLLRYSLRWVGEISTEVPLKRNDLPWLGLSCLFGGIAAPVLLMLGLARTDAASASLFLNLETVFTISLAWFAFKEYYDRKVVMGVLLVLLGGGILSWGGKLHGNQWIGSLLITSACLSWAIDNNITRKISTSDAVQISAIKCSVAGILNLLLGWGTGDVTVNGKILVHVLIIGFLGYGLSLVFFVWGLRYVGTARTAAYFSLAPFIGVVFSFLMLHEKLSSTFGIAAILMLVGVWIHLTEEHKHSPSSIKV